MRRIIRIFLASSITEFANERMSIENFIRNISDKFEENYDVKIQPLLCENFDDAYSKVRKQEEYNEKIRNSDLCFFIFFTKAGEYTREEFDVARKKFEETGKPKIYTYFKVIKDETAEQSLYDFMDELDKTFGHYYGTFEHIDTVKLRILINLKLQEMDFLEVKTENGDCIVDGKVAMHLENVAEFANNKTLELLQTELKKIDTEYCQLKPIYAEGSCDNNFCKHYSDVATKRQNLIDEIEELQKLIFNISLQMSYDDVHGEISLRQKEAYRLFELGDYDGCMTVLNSKDIDDEFLRARRRIEEQDISVCRKYIKEHKTAIEILETMKNYKDRFAEIEKRYEKIVPIILEKKIEIEILFDYTCFLQSQAQSEKAAENIKKEIELRESMGGQEKYSIPRLYNTLAFICFDLNDMVETEKYLLKSIEIYETYIDDKCRFNYIFVRQLSDAYVDIAMFYKNSERPYKSIDYFSKAELVCKQHLDSNRIVIECVLAFIYNKRGQFHREQIEFDKSEKYLMRALEIRKNYSMSDFKECGEDLSKSYMALNALSFDRGNYFEAEKYALKALEIREKLFNIEPDKYECLLADAYETLFLNCQMQKKYNDAIEYHHKSVRIRKKYADDDPVRWLPVLARQYVNAATMFDDTGDFKMTKALYKEAIKINEMLTAINYDLYAFDLAISYNNYAVFYHKTIKELEVAKEYYDKSLTIIENLSKKYPEKYYTFLGYAYERLAELNEQLNKFSVCEDMYNNAVKVFLNGYQHNEEKFSPLLADVYLNLGKLSNDKGYYEKALCFAEQISDVKKREDTKNRVMKSKKE